MLAEPTPFRREARNPDFFPVYCLFFLKKQKLIFNTKLLNLEILIRSCLISVHHHGVFVNFLSGNCFDVKISKNEIDPKTAIVHCARRKSENHQVLPFQSGFRDLKNDRI